MCVEFLLPTCILTPDFYRSEFDGLNHVWLTLMLVIYTELLLTWQMLNGSLSHIALSNHTTPSASFRAAHLLSQLPWDFTRALSLESHLGLRLFRYASCCLWAQEYNSTCADTEVADNLFVLNLLAFDSKRPLQSRLSSESSLGIPLTCMICMLLFIEAYLLVPLNSNNNDNH